MIRVTNLKTDPEGTMEELIQKTAKMLKISPKEFTMKIHKKSLDCRPKHRLQYVYTVDVMLNNEHKESEVVFKAKNPQVMSVKKRQYAYSVSKENPVKHPPVVVGAGPAGLFAAYLLALNGYHPVLIERGKDVDARSQDVDAFWSGKQPLNTESNVQFGEGGAGTFSDGKLNTMVKDKYMRQSFILDTFVSCGAKEEITYLAKPHIGTDYLKKVIKNLREKILALGGTIHFQTKMESLLWEEHNGKKQITGIVAGGRSFATNHVILALGHSARDTFSYLYDAGILMEPKPFAIGVRMEHEREFINKAQYKEHYQKHKLPTADYKLTYHAKNDRSVYTFCMCPGGYVVNASSENGRLVVNGMSNHDRMADNSNSAIVVNVTPKDFGSDHPLAGVSFQRKWEEKAYQIGNGNIPVQCFKDFKENKTPASLLNVSPCQKGRYHLANVRECLPEEVSSAIIESVLAWDKIIPGYAKDSALISGIESRTSSPVRILRGEDYQSSIKGLYPCGEGAGYAGGIMSAAMDGLKVAEAIMKTYAPS